MTATLQQSIPGERAKMTIVLPEELKVWLRTYAAERSMSVNLAVAEAIRQMQATSEKE